MMTIGHEPADKKLRELGVDPDVARSQGDELPDVARSQGDELPDVLA